MAIGPNIWGPHGWKFLHFIAMAYPNEPTNEDKQKYLTFFTLVGDLLPCQLCIDNYKKHLLIYPITDEVLSSKSNLLKWSIDMHNEVNKENNKKVYTYNEAVALISNNYNEEQKKVEPKSDNSKPDNEKPDNAKPDNAKPRSNNLMLYTFIFLFIMLILIAVVYKKT
uniref:thiol oxidase n=1 Tax=viral metagenome TaxID=1070528 RepID=A0A6C0DA81_9ZZZZ